MIDLDAGTLGQSLMVFGAVGLLLSSAAGFFTRSWGTLARLALFAVISSVLSVAYWAYAQREAGLSDSLVPNPKELLEKAEQVKRQAQQRNRAIRRSLKTGAPEKKRKKD
ncbi:MAG: hypothetical protein AAFQ82_23505 [Myxococcota bacterium]